MVNLGIWTRAVRFAPHPDHYYTPTHAKLSIYIECLACLISLTGCSVISGLLWYATTVDIVHTSLCIYRIVQAFCFFYQKTPYLCIYNLFFFKLIIYIYIQKPNIVIIITQQSFYMPVIPPIQARQPMYIQAVFSLLSSSQDQEQEKKRAVIADWLYVFWTVSINYIYNKIFFKP